MYYMSTIIDETCNVPKIKNSRVTLFDIMMTIRISQEPKTKIKENWGLSDDEAQEVLDYIDKNEKELKQKENKLN